MRLAIGGCACEEQARWAGDGGEGAEQKTGKGSKVKTLSISVDSMIKKQKKKVVFVCFSIQLWNSVESYDGTQSNLL